MNKKMVSYEKEKETIIKILKVDSRILLTIREMDDIAEHFVLNHIDKYKDVIIEPLETLMALNYLNSAKDSNYKNFIEKKTDPFEF